MEFCQFCGREMVYCGNGVWTCQHSEPFFAESFRIAKDGSVVTHKVRYVSERTIEQ